MQTDPRFPNLRIEDHPIVLDRLSKMRMTQTPTRDFRTLLYEITLLMGCKQLAIEVASFIVVTKK